MPEQNDDEIYKIELNKLLGQIANVNKQIAAHKDAIAAISNNAISATDAQEQVKVLEEEVYKLESINAYFEFSIFMTYGLKKALDEDDSNDKTRQALIQKIKDKNAYYWKK